MGARELRLAGDEEYVQPFGLLPGSYDTEPQGGAERFKDRAIAFGFSDSKIFGCRSSASLCSVTSPDHFFISCRLARAALSSLSGTCQVGLASSLLCYWNPTARDGIRSSSCHSLLLPRQPKLARM